VDADKLRTSTIPSDSSNARAREGELQQDSLAAGCVRCADREALPSGGVFGAPPASGSS
jgi:hypothetical protein